MFATVRKSALQRVMCARAYYWNGYSAAESFQDVALYISIMITSL
jgi:hypothetical protein